MAPDAFDVIYFPKWKVQKHLIGVGGYTILEKSKNHELAWEWLKHTTTADAISTVFGPLAPDHGNTSTPARRSVLTAAGYGPTGPRHWEVFYGTLDKYPNTTPIPAPSLLRGAGDRLFGPHHARVLFGQCPVGPDRVAGGPREAVQVGQTADLLQALACI